MSNDLIIVGCGGFGREVADVVNAINANGGPSPTWNLLGFLDDSPSEDDSVRVARIGSKVLGSPAENLGALKGASYVIGIGSGNVRQTLAARADAAGLIAATLIHPSANVGADVEIAQGSVLCAGVAITTNVRIGRHVHINLNSTVGHDSALGDFVTINPLVAVSGNCSIDSFVNLGTHSAVLPGLKIGEGSIVGAGACVVKDVADGQTVKGVPAR